MTEGRRAIKATYYIVTILLALVTTSEYIHSQTLSLRQTIETRQPVFSLSFSPDKKILACGGNYILRLFDTKTGALLHILGEKDDDFNETINTVDFSPDGKLIASAGDEAIIRIWNVQTGKQQKSIVAHSHQIPGPHSYRIMSIKFSPDGKVLASVSGGHESLTSPLYGEIKLWDVKTGKLLVNLPSEKDFIWSVTFSPDGKTLVTANENQTVKIWDLQTKQLKRTLTGYNGSAYSPVYSSDGTRLVTGSKDNLIRIWNTQTWELDRTLSGHSDRVFTVAIYDNKIVSNGGSDHTIRIWDMLTGEAVTVIKADEYWNTVAVSSDGKNIAAGSADGTVMIWKIG